MLTQNCSACIHPEDGVCTNCVGSNGMITEVSEWYWCSNWKGGMRKPATHTEIDRLKTLLWYADHAFQDNWAIDWEPIFDIVEEKEDIEEEKSITIEIPIWFAEQEGLGLV